MIVVSRPTVIVFFRLSANESSAVTQETNEALADFHIYAKQVRDRLAKMGIDFREVYASSFRVTTGGKSTTFHIGPATARYYVVAPGKEPRIEYGVETDSDLVQIATEYFRVSEP